MSDSLYAHRDSMKKKYLLAIMMQTALRSYQWFRLLLLGAASTALWWDLQLLLALQIQSVRGLIKEVFELKQHRDRSNRVKWITCNVASSSIIIIIVATALSAMVIIIMFLIISNETFHIIIIIIHYHFSCERDAHRFICSFLDLDLFFL